MKHRIGQSMTQAPVTIGPQVTIGEAREIMRMWGMRHLPVTNDEETIVGILSDRDFSKTFMTNLKASDYVTEIMTPNPYVLLQDMPILTALETMADHKYGCVIVVNIQREVLGIFTTTDALNILIKLLKNPGPENFKVLKIEDYLKFYRGEAC